MKKNAPKQLILVIFDSEWIVIMTQMMQLRLLIIYTNLLVLYMIFFDDCFVKTLEIINTCEFAMSNRKMRIKILMNVLKNIDSLWINTCINVNVLNDENYQMIQQH